MKNKMKSWPEDISKMHEKYGVNVVVNKMDPPTLRKYLEFRIRFLEEELDELKKAVQMDYPHFIVPSVDGDETVDALIDLCVVAIGTLDVFGIDAQKAWDRVQKANMSKEVGVKKGRPNPLNLPDLIKPTMESHGREWISPNHSDNIGLLEKLEESGKE